MSIIITYKINVYKPTYVHVHTAPGTYIPSNVHGTSMCMYSVYVYTFTLSMATNLGYQYCLVDSSVLLEINIIT